ncbi:MAG TPA: hypothetical protein VLM36_04355 [Sphingomicrobium sp.]|nr:hypothetical protein [Sphingomicrobium sp.]
MTTLLILVLAIGLSPLALGFIILNSGDENTRIRPTVGSILLCALSFNLTFLWQELWLVIPKALTPGLHPVLYHNDHEWTGTAPVAELLQGSGAVATLVSGLLFCAALRLAGRLSATARLFLFWMSFEGIFQSLTQVAIGALLAGNDVGRALGYLQVSVPARWGVLALAIIAMGAAGIWLAGAYPADLEPMPVSRKFGTSLLLTAMVAILLIVPFRVPRNLVEVALIPFVVNFIGVGWVVLGAGLLPRRPHHLALVRPRVAGPSFAIAAALLLFQLVLRRGIAF